jgi:hypothetical protein
MLFSMPAVGRLSSLGCELLGIWFFSHSGPHLDTQVILVEK